MKKAFKQSLPALAMIAIFGTTGCPNDENNGPGNLSDMGTDALNDLVTDGDTDQPDEGKDSVRCELLNSSPRTLPLDGDPARITWTFLCSQPIANDALGLITPRDLTMNLEIPIEGLCQPAVQDYICTFSANGLIAPSDNNVRSEVFEISYGAEEPLITDVRWHHSADALNANFAIPVIELDKAVITGGLGVSFYKPSRRQGRIRAVYKQKLQSTEVRIVPPTGGVSTATVDVPLAWEDLLAQNTESVQNTDGSTEMFWWGYDGKNKRFVGASLVSDEDGNEIYKRAYDSELVLENNVALVTILDARAVRAPRPPNMGPSDGVAIFVMGLNASGNLVFHLPFGLRFNNEFDKGTFFGLDESKFSSKTIGFVKQQGSVDDFFTNTNDDYFLVWSALPNASKDKLNITLFPSYSAGTPSAIPTELDTGFAVTDTYVSQSSPGSIIVLAHGAQNARAMYRLTYELKTDPETGEETETVTSHVQLELPDNVDVRPSPCYTPKKDTPKQDGAWECKDSVLSCDKGGCGSTHFRTLGRWPWNWRNATDASEPSQPMILDWNDDGTLNRVFPLVVDSSPSTSNEEGPLIISELDNGRALSVHTTSFSSEACANPEDCLVQVAHGVVMGPGTDAPTFYIQRNGKHKEMRHLTADYNKSFLHFGTKRPSGRIIAPVIPGTSTTATHVIVDLASPTDGSDTINSAQINITVNNAPIDPNLVLHGVVPHLVGDDEELVLIFQPLIVGEGEDVKVTILSISGAEIDAALANSDKVTTIDTLGAPLEFTVQPTFGISSIQIVIRNNSRMAPVGGVNTTVLSANEDDNILLIYTSPKTGTLVVGSLSKKANADYVLTELDLTLAPARQTPLTRVSQTNVPGANDLLFATSSSEAFFIRRRTDVSGANVLDVATRTYAFTSSDLFFDAATYETGDFNGDGIADLYVSPDFSTLLPNAILTGGDASCVGCLIYFGDGLGGFLENPMKVPAGPWMQWSVDGGIHGLSTESGKGTMKTTTKTISRVAL